jgi:hypothetical protein
MESMLLVVTVVSLALGGLMTVVAWRLLRESHGRSAARVEALQVMAHDPDEDDEIVPAAPAPRALASPVIDEGAAEWDFALHGPPAPHHAPQPAPQPARMPQRIVAPAPAQVEMHATHPASSRQLIEATPLFVSAPDRRAPGRRGLALAAIVLVMIAGGGSAYALRTWDVFGAIAKAASSKEVQPLELLSLRHVKDNAGNFTVTGLVQNPAGGRSLQGVVAVIYLFDQQGQYVTSGRARLDVTAFQAGDESPFVVKIPNAGGVSRYRVGFRLEDGGVVAHVDRRGQVPDGTTEDAIEHGQGPSLSSPIAPRRSEG